jgi:uncharacterized Zn-finger protein
MRKIFNFKCPFCESDEIYLQHDGDYIDLKDETFVRETTCQFCSNKFSITGQIKGPLYVRE